jgi:hypothetical protein
VVAAWFRYCGVHVPATHHGDWNLWDQFAALRVVALVRVAASAVIPGAPTPSSAAGEAGIQTSGRARQGPLSTTQ